MAECANPLLLSWVKEWLDTARERNSKGVTTYKKAYDSMKSCPLPFTHPSEAQQLTGFGPKLCSRLTDKLKDYCEEHGLPMPEMPHKQRKKGTNKEKRIVAKMLSRRRRQGSRNHTFLRCDPAPMP
jgi:crossover junction endonuclease MUS81